VAKRTLGHFNEDGEQLTWTSDEDEPADVPIHPMPSSPPPIPELLDVSNPERGTFVTRSGTGVNAGLDRIALLFRNPHTLKDDGYLLEEKSISEIKDAADLLKQILRELRNLAVVTPLIALLVVSSNTSLRLRVHSIVERVRAVAMKHRKHEYSIGKYFYLMNGVIQELEALGRLIHIFKGASPDMSVRLKKMKGYLIHLQSDIEKYVRSSFAQEEYPKWYLSDRSQNDRLDEWIAEKPMRILVAYQKALNDYMSVKCLREEIDMLERMMAPKPPKCKSLKRAQSDTPSSSKDNGQPESSYRDDECAADVPIPSGAADVPIPSGAADVPIPSDDGAGPSSDQNMEKEEHVDKDAIVKEATDVQAALLDVVYGKEEIRTALLAVIRIATSGSSVFDDTEWKKLVDGLLTAARQGTYYHGAIGYRHVIAIKTLRKFLRKAGKQLATLNLQTAEWWANNNYDVPKPVLVDLINETDSLQDNELQDLKETDAYDGINRALESVRIIASSTTHRKDKWDTLASALASLYRIYNDQQRPLAVPAVERLICFLERAANILRMKWKESRQYFDLNIAHFVNPQSSNGNNPMELGAAGGEGW